MHRTISTLMALGVVTTACSGGGGSGTVSTDTTDRTAPVVTVTGSSTSVEGGETVALTISANDAVDGALTSTLSCNGGTLVGTLLVTSPVAADTSINCTATATDKAGNTGTGAVTIAVKKTVATLAPGTSSISLMQGQLGVLFADNLPLTQTSYQGDIDGAAVTFGRATSTGLVYSIPEGLAPGAHRLNVTVEGRRYSYAITVTAAPSSSDPKAVVRAVLTDMKAQMDAQLAAGGMSSIQRSKVIEYRDGLVEGLTQIDSLSAAALASLALHFQANGIYQPATARALAYNPQECEVAANVFYINVIDTVSYVGVAWAAFAVPEPIVTKLFGLAVSAKAIRALARTIVSVGEVVSKCIDEKRLFPEFFQNSERTSAQFVRALAPQAGAGFQNKKPRSFRLARELAMEPGVAAKAQSIMGKFTQAIAQMPVVPDDIAAAVNSFYTSKIEYVPASRVGFGGTSNSQIGGSMSGSGETLTLTFTAAPEVTSNAIDFNFTLNVSGSAPVTIPATLTLALPNAQDAAVTLIQGTPIQSTVQVTGADRVEITQAPGHGTATITANGLLSYTPSGQYFGSDTLKYRSVNSDGYSRIATVLFTIDRRFEGMWNIRSQSTTTSQSRQGLCPNELNNFQISIAKNSDTSYSTSYGGFPIPLTMASKDDPAGLRGQVSGTYDDDPGETTETLTVAVPDSTHIVGNTIWSYAGPNGDRCTGSTTITGTRP